jgi:hypothetical protein
VDPRVRKTWGNGQSEGLLFILEEAIHGSIIKDEGRVGPPLKKKS